MFSESIREMPLRAAVVGCGPVGQIHAETLSAHPMTELVGVCAPSKARRDPLARRLATRAFPNLNELMDQVACDVVCIASPDETHWELTRDALLADKHVLCEKPLGQAACEAQQLQQMAESRNLALGVTYNRRYGFAYRQATALLSEGRIGNLHQCWLQVTDHTPSARVATRSDIIFWTLLTHHFDLIRHLCGDVQSVTARIHSSRDDQIVDSVNVILDLRLAGSATLTAAYRDNQSRTTERCELVGSRGSIIVDNVTESVQCYGTDPDQVHEYRPNPFLAGNAFYESLKSLIIDFVNCLSNAQPPTVTARDAVISMQLAEAALRSHREGSAVAVS